MATYGDMQTRIADEIHRDDLTSQIQNAILSAVAFYAGQRFSGNEKRGTITTISGTRFYATDTASPGTLPTDIAEIDSVVLTVSGRDYQLERVAYDHLESIDAGATLTLGDPTVWAWYSGQLRLYPTPNAARTVTLSYQTILTALSSSSDSNFWTNDGEALIRSRAKRSLAMHYTMDQVLSQAMGVAEQEELTALKRRADKLISSGRIRPTSF
jgi:hypothetical protein